MPLFLYKFVYRLYTMIKVKPSIQFVGSFNHLARLYKHSEIPVDKIWDISHNKEMSMTQLKLLICKSVHLSLVAENTARGAGILGEHGLCWWVESDGRMVPAGDRHFAAALETSPAKVVTSRAPVEVLRGIWTTGEVPRETDFEDTGGKFFCGDGGGQRDALPDDLSLFFRTEAGLVVVLGCAHAGVVNILRHCMQLTGESVHAVVGGMHLLHASENRMRATLGALREIAPRWLAPNHCTGDAAVAQLYAAFPGQVLELHAGQSLNFPLSD